MSIVYEKLSRTFSLHTNRSTYQMQVDRLGYLLHLYYGRRTQGVMDYNLYYGDWAFSGNPNDAGTDRTYSMDVLPQEFPTLGTGDYRSTALQVKNADGSRACDLRFSSFTIEDGKYSIPGLPAVYADDRDAQTLVIHLKDSVTGVEANLYYGVLPKYDIITRSVRIINHGKDTIILEKLQPACLDFMGGSFDVISFYGRHVLERQFDRRPVSHGSFVIGSRRGTSSHQYNPFLILADHEATERSGSCYGVSFAYSGGFLAEVEQDQYNHVRLLMGLQPEQFAYPLAQEESLFAPEVILTYSANGLGNLSRNLHKCYRHNLCRGKYQLAHRPILINSWEASYFDFTGETIYDLAKEAADLGIEMLVMDDGWFGARSDDNAGLGDWQVNETKLGGSLGELVERINALGLKFGIWYEPEMVNENSDLFRSHPDWALSIPGRGPVRSRNQLVLDFSRKEVVDEIYRQMCEVLDSCNIEYVKWDMNRSLADCYSRSGKDSGKVMYDYVLGVYDLLERLITRYPDILFEGCSGGGGRFDAGMLYYTPQIWCSDNTDAIDRVKIQYGTSFGYPVSAVGSHVSASPNHQSGRVMPMHTRGVVAMSGDLGYELNPAKCTSEEKEEVRRQIKEFIKRESLIMNGDYYRLTNPWEQDVAAWAFVSEDQSEVLVNVVMQVIHGNPIPEFLRLDGLKEHALYRNTETGKIYPANALMESGIILPFRQGEYLSWQMHFEMVKEIE